MHVKYPTNGFSSGSSGNYLFEVVQYFPSESFLLCLENIHRQIFT